MECLLNRLKFLFPFLCVLSVVLSGSFAFSVAEKQVTLKDLDAVVARHADLQSFLKNKNAVDEYFASLSAYMGPEKMNREKFNAILIQLQELSQKSPLLSQRLWETTGTGTPFSVQSTAVSYGRKLGKDWDPEIYLKNAPAISSEREKEIARLTRIVETNEKSLNLEGLTRDQRGQAQARHFEKIRASEEVRILSDHYAQMILNSEDTKELLRSGDPDLILDTLKSMSANPRAFLPQEIQIPGSVLTELKKRLPNFQALMSNKDMFPEIVRETRNGSVGSGISRPGQYDFKPVPRRLHGIWKGIPIGECVGGGCATSVSARRWTTVALKDSQLYFLEKNGRYSGFVEAIPGTIGDKTFVSLGFGAPDLRKKIYSSGPNGERIQSTLYRKFLDEARPRLPDDWNGFILSASTDINNAGVASTSQSSVAFNWGEKVSPTDSFRITDPLVQEIATLTPGNSYSSSQGIMIIDALTPSGERNLRILSQLPESMMTDPNAVIELLKSADTTTGENVINAVKKDPAFLKKIRPGIEAFISRGAGSFAEDSAALLYFDGGVNLDNDNLVKNLLHGLKGNKFAELIGQLDQRHIAALRTVPLKFFQWPQSKEKLVFATLLKLDPELKDPLNKAWVNKLISLVAEQGESKVLEELKLIPAVRSEILKMYPHLIEQRNAKQLVDWIRLHPEELNYSFMKTFRSTNPGTIELSAFSEIVTQAVVSDPKKLSEVMEAISAHSLDGPEAKPLIVTIRNMLLGADKKSVEAVSEALSMNIDFARAHFKSEMLKIARGSSNRPGWRDIVSGYLNFEVDGNDIALMKKIFASNDEELIWKILTGIEGPLSPEMWETVRNLKPTFYTPDFEFQKVDVIRRLDPDFQIPENKKFMRRLIAAHLEPEVQITKLSTLVNHGVDKSASRLLGEEIVRLKKYDLFFELGNTVSNASDVYHPIIRAAGDVEFSEALIRQIKKTNPGESQFVLQQVEAWKDQIRLHPNTWSKVLPDLKRDHPSIGVSVESGLAKVPALQGTGRCSASVTEILNGLLQAR